MLGLPGLTWSSGLMVYDASGSANAESIRDRMWSNRKCATISCLQSGRFRKVYFDPLRTQHRPTFCAGSSKTTPCASEKPTTLQPARTSLLGVRFTPKNSQIDESWMILQSSKNEHYERNRCVYLARLEIVFWLWASAMSDLVSIQGLRGRRLRGLRRDGLVGLGGAATCRRHKEPLDGRRRCCQLLVTATDDRRRTTHDG